MGLSSERWKLCVGKIFPLGKSPNSLDSVSHPIHNLILDQLFLLLIKLLNHAFKFLHCPFYFLIVTDVLPLWESNSNQKHRQIDFSHWIAFSYEITFFSPDIFFSQYNFFLVDKFFSQDNFFSQYNFFWVDKFFSQDDFSHKINFSH